MLENENFVGYKIPQRLSEFIKKYPDLVEKKKEDRFTLYRLKSMAEYPAEFFKNYEIQNPHKLTQNRLDIELPRIVV